MSPTTSIVPLPLRQPPGYAPAHHKGSPPTGFKNPWPSYQNSTLPTLLKARWITPKDFVPVPPDRAGLVEVQQPDFAVEKDGLKSTWIGHASFLIEMPRQKGGERGVRLLLDPVWSERVGPYGMVGPVRFSPPPCTIDELPEVDAICISHDHYDHLDSDTLQKLNTKYKSNLHYFCGLRVKAVLIGLGIGIKEEQITELDWWDGITLEKDGLGKVDVICTPAQHRSGRAPWNFDGTLWCSWAIKESEPEGKRLFFAGDTGYCHVTSDTEFSHHNQPHPPCPAFKHIGELYGPFDLALVPAGCFKPRSVLSGQHASPEDSLAIHKDVRSKKSIAMHYGTFRGAFSAQYEPVTEPAERWKKGAEVEGLKWGEEVGVSLNKISDPFLTIPKVLLDAHKSPMTKRKRANNNQKAVDVGLGATLAHLRGDDEPKNATTAADDEQGWTVVEGTKRRRRERDSNYGNRQNDSHQLAPENPFAMPNHGSDNPSMSREERRKQRKLDRNYPSIEHSHHARLQSHVKISDLQSLVLYLLADGNAPQWVSVRSRTNIQKVVMLMVPGLDLGMFNGNTALKADVVNINTELTAPSEVDTEPKWLRISPDDFYPATLRSSRLPTVMKPLADIFDHVWPIKASGEHRGNQFVRLHSSIHTMLTAQIPRTQEEKQLKKRGNHKGPVPQNSKHWDSKRTRITEYVASLTDQQENEYVPHPAMFTTPESKEVALQRRREVRQDVDDGWVDTNVTSLDDGVVPEADIEQGSVTAGRRIISVDCEMCKAENDEFVLTRVSLLDWDGSVVMDKLVKPDVTVKDYLTQYSGITAAMLEDVTTTLSDIQKELLELITPRTILVGHSLNSDLNALKLTHPFLIDTGILYPHPRGPPYKQSLKWLAQKFLHREVQKGTTGHDSVEDARTCLDLVKQKCEKGPAWGTGDTNAESIFKRLGRSTRPKSNKGQRNGAVIDWGEPNRGHGNHAKVSIGCKSDEEVVEAIDRAVRGNAVGKEGSTETVDFIWARLRELELCRGWWDDAKTADVEAIRQTAMQRIGLSREDTDAGADVELKGSDLGDAVSRVVSNIVQIYESLPRCTAFVVYSGTGDPREIRRLQAMQQQYRREYQTKNWDNLSVKWTDTEMQALSNACQEARNGVGFIGVK
ncbi:beta-lactamase superfamily domain-containing protein [Phaeosphaeriaceae sp. PMI808]|nr:beta-lactamase superfamily domain-containing protein [Phaeosphaeriaceae sp. PMI808]